MTAISAATAEPTQATPRRPTYLDEVDPANEQHEGAAAVESDLSFDDLIDLLNPLQHLPVVSTIYRAITGDQIQPHVRAIGSGIYGGPVGFLAAGAAMAIEEAVGTTPDKVLAGLFDDEPDASDQTIASAPEAGPVADPAQATAVLTTAPSTAAVTAAATSPSATEAKADAPGAQTMFTIKDRPNFFTLPDKTDRRMPLAPRPYAEPSPIAQGATARTALAAQAEMTGATRPASASGARPDATLAAQGLSTAQGDLLDRFVTGTNGPNGAKAAPTASQDAPASPPGPSPEWIATQMQANLQKYADAQGARNPGS